MKRRTIYIILVTISFVIISMYIFWSQPAASDKTSFYYTSYDTLEEEKNYYTKQQSDYIESFFINCHVTNSSVISLFDAKQEPTFVYKDEDCWIYSLTSQKYMIKKGNVCYVASRDEVEKLANQLENFSLDKLKTIE